MPWTRRNRHGPERAGLVFQYKLEGDRRDRAGDNQLLVEGVFGVLLRIYVGGVEQVNTSDEVDWQPRSFSVLGSIPRMTAALRGKTRRGWTRCPSRRKVFRITGVLRLGVAAI